MDSSLSFGPVNCRFCDQPTTLTPDNSYVVLYAECPEPDYHHLMTFCIYCATKAEIHFWVSQEELRAIVADWPVMHSPNPSAADIAGYWDVHELRVELTPRMKQLLQESEGFCTEASDEDIMTAMLDDQAYFRCNLPRMWVDKRPQSTLVGAPLT